MCTPYRKGHGSEKFETLVLVTENAGRSINIEGSVADAMQSFTKNGITLLQSSDNSQIKREPAVAGPIGG